MNIKNSLLVSFIVFVGLVIFIGVTFIIINNKTTKYLYENQYHYSILTLWSEFDKDFEDLYRNLNYFMILESEVEKEKFRSQSKLINSRYNELKEKINPLDKNNLDLFINDFTVFNNLSMKLFDLKTNKFGYFENKIEPLVKKIKNCIQNNINTQRNILSTIENNIRTIRIRSIQISIFVSVISLISALVSSYLLFISITKPIKKLQIFTREVGKGEINSRIIIKKPQEIVNLANAFNKMLDDLNESQLKILQMDRMASIGELAGGIAHEINNPLTGILGQAQLLLEKLPQDHQYRPTIEKIENAAQRCRTIVRSLLDFARDKDYKFRPAEIHELINKTIELIETEITSKKIHIEKYIPDNLPKVNVSTGHIQQVFLNIITNAIYAMPNGGNLYIKVDRENNFLKISFRDTGIGIKKEHLPHIFDPFFTTKDIGKGAGLGLSVSYGIIKKHNGEIIAISEGENKGAEFIVKIPYLLIGN